jgi:hypothetical protein
MNLPPTELTTAVANEEVLPQARASIATAPSRAQTLEAVAFEAIELSQAEMFRGALSKYPHITSEMSFANFFGWAPIQYPRWGSFNGHILVTYDPGNTGNNTRFLPPIGPDPVGTMARLVALGAQFVRVDAALALKMPQGVSVQFNAGDYDYLYTPTQIESLEGSPCSENRRRLRRFNEDFQSRVSTIDITPATLELAERVVDQWLTARLQTAKTPEDRTGRIEDATGCRRILSAWNSFPELRGRIVLIDGSPVSLGIAELKRDLETGQNTLVSHYEKCDLTIKGLPIWNFQQLCQGLSPSDLINRMQDTGAPGLREWKESWGPKGQIRKAVVGAHEYFGTLIPEPVLFGFPPDDIRFLRQ